MIETRNLAAGASYIGGTDTIFVLIKPYAPDVECFRREHDGKMFFGREFIEVKRGRVSIKLNLRDTTCLICEDDYGDIADESFIAGVCPDCMSTYSSEEQLTKLMEK